LGGDGVVGFVFEEDGGGIELEAAGDSESYSDFFTLRRTYFINLDVRFCHLHQSQTRPNILINLPLEPILSPIYRVPNHLSFSKLSPPISLFFGVFLFTSLKKEYGGAELLCWEGHEKIIW